MFNDLGDRSCYIFNLRLFNLTVLLRQRFHAERRITCLAIARAKPSSTANLCRLIDFFRFADLPMNRFANDLVRDLRKIRDKRGVQFQEFRPQYLFGKALGRLDDDGLAVHASMPEGRRP